jgi:hypothetical protein
VDELIMQKELIDKQKLKKSHMAAADHHKKASEHHAEAAKYHELGNHEKGNHHAYLAHSHSQNARKYSTKISLNVTELNKEQP